MSRKKHTLRSAFDMDSRGHASHGLRAPPRDRFSIAAALDAEARLFEPAGAGAALDGLGLARFGRHHDRTHTRHDPARWEYPAAGDFYLHGRVPPDHGAL